VLTGTVRSADEFAASDFRRRSPRFQSENLARNLSLVDELEAFSAELGITAAQLALAWVHAQGDDLISIPGTKDPSRAAQNVAALEIALSAETLARLDVAVATQPLVGERYPASVMRTIGV
jgi:aryl-alcohol dehydrogenase-like predicted oxidoreductase